MKNSPVINIYKEEHYLIVNITTGNIVVALEHLDESTRALKNLKGFTQNEYKVYKVNLLNI
jgi:hypothetical protein